MRIAALALVALLAMGQSAAAAETRYRVCLDPGHGGTDSGAVRGALIEKELNLDIAGRVRDALDPALYLVTLTRDTTDVSLGNSERAQICNAFGAQVVLSIHLNASTDASVDYAWVFYGKRSKDLKLAQTVDANYVISDAYGSGPLRHKAITNFANGTLLRSNAPAALVEGLFMSHTEEQRLLVATDPGSRRQQVAAGLVAGIRAFAGR